MKELEPAQEQPKDEASDEIEQSPAGADEKEAQAEDDKQQQQQSEVGGLAAEVTSSVAADSRASRIAGMLQKRAATSKRGKAPPTLANLSLVLPRPLVRPSQPEKKGRKVNLQAASGKNLQANSGKKLQASSSNLQAKSSKKTAILYNQDRQRQGKENQSIECNPGNFSKRESKETLGEDLELDLRTCLALRKSPMTNSERQLLQLDHKTDWTLWEESCLAD